jgi:hypothetical protein
LFDEEDEDDDDDEEDKDNDDASADTDEDDVDTTSFVNRIFLFFLAESKAALSNSLPTMGSALINNSFGIF